MKLSKNSVIRVILVVLLILVTFFIFKNSFENLATSHQYSENVMDVIAPNRDATDYSGNSNMERLIRKSAHLVEYAVLGVVVMALALNIRNLLKNAVYGISLFYALFIAVLDEHIQSFSERTSSTGDILLDFVGSMIGFAVVLVVYFIYVKCKNKRATGNDEPLIS
ncbi:MAG: VanZ family protein [Clostridia bacterium]|nr:VanZ family protein [Clostridia bacterium]